MDLTSIVLYVALCIIGLDGDSDSFPEEEEEQDWVSCLEKKPLCDNIIAHIDINNTTVNQQICSEVIEFFSCVEAALALCDNDSDKHTMLAMKTREINLISQRCLKKEDDDKKDEVGGDATGKKNSGQKETAASCFTFAVFMSVLSRVKVTVL
ncbi:hypothetical protein Bpfe_020950 [Biomphalaria pfeifferi]|uniref:IMS import disulfide relay-system CHCH-CHCH-like Cx9C domain-containing protein n=1 Tax=Biomphalaria pfeifferi TaxID=112525 RepID=A0AAD8F3S9_BIOPF|nr:hypothetical protein Bpfe_020950 [Biomphalaria pfeifferi]